MKLFIYIANRYGKASVTAFMKLCYLIDLVATKNGVGKITKFQYLRYNYGPFDQDIYTYLRKLLDDGIFIDNAEVTISGQEYLVYDLVKKQEDDPDFFSESERAAIDEVLDAVKGCTPATLTQIAYKTNPMKALNATLGGNEYMGAVLDLAA